MRIPINNIKLNPGRRTTEPEDVESLAKSIAELGLLNPITINQDNTLIAGRHRLEAAKLLGWTEIECIVRDLQGLQAELAEIDENFVRKNLSIIDFGNLLLRRKEIYEILHPETKQGKFVHNHIVYRGRGKTFNIILQIQITVYIRCVFPVRQNKTLC